MTAKEYYSVRSGRHPTGGRLDFEGLKRLVLAIYADMFDGNYFQQVLGFHCVDEGVLPGSAGSDIDAYFFKKLKKHNLWPIPDRIGNYTEDDLFDVVELLHDCASKGVDGTYHSWNDCGWHYSSFDSDAGQNDFRLQMNEVLREYGPGYQLDKDGQIFVSAPIGLGDLEDAPAPPGDSEGIQARVQSAVQKFRRRGATLEDRRDVVRDLADVLEFIRQDAKEVLDSEDEKDLFTLANKFGIRHHNQSQKTNYDKAIWYSWMYYYYLAAIHATSRLIERAQQSASQSKQS